jgi:Zn finger protein HypA/HybF involved in hydrogenase expression
MCCDVRGSYGPPIRRVVDYVGPVGEDHRLSWWTRRTTQECRDCGTRSAYRQWQKELIHRDRKHKTFRYRCPQCNESFLKTENFGDGGFYG